jgi:hypothetical protein
MECVLELFSAPGYSKPKRSVQGGIRNMNRYAGVLLFVAPVAGPALGESPEARV